MGLTEAALEFEAALNSRDFNKSQKILISSLYDAHESKSNTHVTFWTRQRSRLHAILNLYKRPRFHLRIFFCDFWSGFIPDESPLLELLRLSLEPYVLVVTFDVYKADIIISSCFGSSSIAPTLPILANCLYLGENVRPSFTQFDFSLTFDEDDYCGRNVYVPLWYLRTDIFNNSSDDSELIPCDVICTPMRYLSKSNPVVMIATNMTPQRMSFLELSRRHNVKVDCYGSSFRPVASKVETMKDYNYAVAFENSYSPGYVTEKVFDAYVSGAIPLYAGSNSTLCPINMDKVIDMTPHLRAGSLPQCLISGTVDPSMFQNKSSTGLVSYSTLSTMNDQIRQSIQSFFNWLPS